MPRSLSFRVPLFVLFTLISAASARTAGPRFTAPWITAPGLTSKTAQMPLFRKQFTLAKKPLRATLYVSALGQGEVHLNGAKVGDAELTPAWTDYRKTIRYEAYDIASQLHPGENVIGVMVGNGMFNVVKTPHRYTKFEGSFGTPRILLQLELEFPDRTHTTIVSDSTWKTTPGPIVFSSTYGGEDYDATREISGWDTTAGFREADWQNAVVTDSPGGELLPEVAPPIRILHTYTPIASTHPTPAATVYDLGQNFAGWPEIKVRGKRGATIKLIPGDLLHPDGAVWQRSSGSPQWFSYTLKGAGEETWHPRFSYYGQRWVQVEWTGEGELLSIAGQAVHSSSPQAGTFTTSNDMLNAIHKLIVEAMHNNEVSLFTDCPHREKLGWLEETHLVAPGLMFNNDLRGLYAATDRNMADAQHADGDVPTIAPQYTVFGPQYPIYDDSPEWGSAVVLAPWAAYRFYGDASKLARSYPAMKRYVAFLESKATDGIVSYGLGDWYDIGPNPPGVSQLTSPGVTGTLMLYEDARDLARIATILHHSEDAAIYAALAESEKQAFNHRFFDSAKQVYDKGSQTAQSMPLALGIVPEAARAAVLDKLITDIHAHEDHTTSGEVGFAYTVRALTSAGRSDVLLAMLLRKDPPSYGSQLAAGATSLTEAWDAKNGSQDHFMLGDAEEWFYHGLAGFDIDRSREDAAKRITIHPQTPFGLNDVKATYAGFISEWHRSGNTIALTVTIPQGGEATLQLPSGAKHLAAGTTTYHWTDAGN